MLMKQVVMALTLSLSALAHAQWCKPDSISAHTPTAQFTDHYDGTVTDNKTGLMWKRCSEGQTWDSGTGGCNDNNADYTWDTALKQAQTVNTSGGFASYTDWRLPNINELESIVEGQCYLPAINLAVFPNTNENARFWSSSLFAHDLHNYTWYVGFIDGLNGFDSRSSMGQVRLVRSGQ